MVCVHYIFSESLLTLNDFLSKAVICGSGNSSVAGFKPSILGLREEGSDTVLPPLTIIARNLSVIFERPSSLFYEYGPGTLHFLRKSLNAQWFPIKVCHLLKRNLSSSRIQTPNLWFKSGEFYHSAASAGYHCKKFVSYFLMSFKLIVWKWSVYTTFFPKVC